MRSNLHDPFTGVEAFKRRAAVMCNPILCATVTCLALHPNPITTAPSGAEAFQQRRAVHSGPALYRAALCRALLRRAVQPSRPLHRGRSFLCGSSAVQSNPTLPNALPCAAIPRLAPTTTPPGVEAFIPLRRSTLPTCTVRCQAVRYRAPTTTPPGVEAFIPLPYIPLPYAAL